VLGKRQKERIIPLTKSLQRNITNYKQVVEAQFNRVEGEDYFIRSSKGEKAYPMLIYRIVKHYLDLFAQNSKRSPHLLRHTFATHLLNKGADLNAVKDLLGHANLAATQVYTHNSMEKLKAVFEQAHPKA
jgi:integrase/recombinase XerC